MGTWAQREIVVDRGNMKRCRLGDMPIQARLEEVTELDGWDKAFAFTPTSPSTFFLLPPASSFPLRGGKTAKAKIMG